MEISAMAEVTATAPPPHNRSWISHFGTISSIPKLNRHSNRHFSNRLMRNPTTETCDRHPV